MQLQAGQEPGPRTKRSMLISHRMSKANLPQLEEMCVLQWKDRNNQPERPTLCLVKFQLPNRSIFVKGANRVPLRSIVFISLFSGEISIFIYLLLLEDNNNKNLRRKFVLRSVDLVITGKVAKMHAPCQKIENDYFFPSLKINLRLLKHDSNKVSTLSTVLDNFPQGFISLG